MQVQKLEGYIQDYTKFLQRTRHYDGIYIWESLHHFQQNWDVEAPDFGKMYEKSLQNSTTKRLWKRENYNPKQMMLQFASQQSDFVRQMFRNLLNEEKDIENRIARFKFCCDELLREYKERHPISVENNHYHEDNHMIFLYLAFRWPEVYTFYSFPHFRQTLHLMGTRNLPGPHDLLRFIKVSKTIYRFLAKEEALFEQLHKHLPPNLRYLSQSMLVVQDFYRFVAGNVG
ncbi:MAG: hypothetical protein AAF990_20890 [Bacteroidota bacterium]